MAVMNHVHTYVKYKSKPGYFKCDAPDCIYYVDKELLVNKESLCTICHNQFNLTRDDLRRSRPRCLSCSKTRKAISLRRAFDITKDLGTSSFTDPFGLPQQLNLSKDDDELRFRLEEDE